MISAQQSGKHNEWHLEKRQFREKCSGRQGNRMFFLLWSITNALQNTSPEVYWKSQVHLTPPCRLPSNENSQHYHGLHGRTLKSSFRVRADTFIAVKRSPRWMAEPKFIYLFLLYMSSTNVDLNVFLNIYHYHEHNVLQLQVIWENKKKKIKTHVAAFMKPNRLIKQRYKS